MKDIKIIKCMCSSYDLTTSHKFYVKYSILGLENKRYSIVCWHCIKPIQGAINTSAKISEQMKVKYDDSLEVISEDEYNRYIYLKDIL